MKTKLAPLFSYFHPDLLLGLWKQKLQDGAHRVWSGYESSCFGSADGSFTGNSHNFCSEQITKTVTATASLIHNSEQSSRNHFLQPFGGLKIRQGPFCKSLLHFPLSDAACLHFREPRANAPGMSICDAEGCGKSANPSWPFLRETSTFQCLNSYRLSKATESICKLSYFPLVEMTPDVQTTWLLIVLYHLSTKCGCHNVVV